MGSKEMRQFAALEDAVAALLGTAVRQMALSPRAYHRVIKLARTLADLAAAEQIGTARIADALQYRPRVAEGWIGNAGTSRFPMDGDLTGLRNLREPGLLLTTRAWARASGPWSFSAMNPDCPSCTYADRGDFVADEQSHHRRVSRHIGMRQRAPIAPPGAWVGGMWS